MVYIEYECYAIQELKGENEMNILLSKESATTIALLMLLSLNAVAGMTILVNAAKPTKDPNVIIDGNGCVEITWKSGKLETYCSTTYAKLTGLDNVAIIPNHGYHIEEVEIDNEPHGIADEDGFSLFNIKAKTIAVTFVGNAGVDDVDPEDLDAYPEPNVGLIFDNVLAGGLVTAYTIGLAPPDAISESWDIQTDAFFDQTIIVILVLTYLEVGDVDPADLIMWRTEVELALCDVTLDGWVDGDDVSDVANANPSAEGDPNYESRLDIDGNGLINDIDVNIVNNYNNMQVWEDITTGFFDDPLAELVYVYGVTDRFSIFGVRGK